MIVSRALRESYNDLTPSKVGGAGDFIRMKKIPRSVVFLGLALSLWAACSCAASDSPAVRTIGSLLTCSGEPALPSGKDRQAWRKQGANIEGYANDGSSIFSDKRDSYSDEWTSMRVRLRRPVPVLGFIATAVYISRQPAGDGQTGEDVTIYAVSNGDFDSIVHARGMKELPNAGDNPLVLLAATGDETGFGKIVGKWSMPLSRRQRQNLQHPIAPPNYVPGSHRFPSLAFVSIVPAASHGIAVGCKWFGPDHAPVDGL